MSEVATTGAGDPAPLTCLRSGQSRSRRDQHLLLVVVVGHRVGGRSSEGAGGRRRLRPLADGLDCVEGRVGGHIQDIGGAAADGQAEVVANEGDADRDERAGERVVTGVEDGVRQVRDVARGPGVGSRGRRRLVGRLLWVPDGTEQLVGT